MEIFTPQTLDFLFENRMHDDRDWFLSHHDTYEQVVLQPLRDLVIALIPAVKAIDPDIITEPRVGKTISRVRRDTRFTHDKSLYRDHMWLVFSRDRASLPELPCLYLEIGGQGLVYGAGFYECSPTLMTTLRQMVLADDPLYQKAERLLRQQSVFSLEGPFYKKPHYSDQPPRKREWLERRSVSLVARSNDPDWIFSDQLAEGIAEQFRLLEPAYRFWMVGCERTYLRQED